MFGSESHIGYIKYKVYYQWQYFSVHQNDCNWKDNVSSANALSPAIICTNSAAAIYILQSQKCSVKLNFNSTQTSCIGTRPGQECRQLLSLVSISNKHA